jgi:hypothetical protein
MSPDPKLETAIDLAHCYQPDGKREFDRTSNQGLLKTVSHCHDVNQKLIRAQDELRGEVDRRLRRIKLVLGTLNAFFAMVAAALAVLKFL